jgi:hypothetical protein
MPKVQSYKKIMNTLARLAAWVLRELQQAYRENKWLSPICLEH